MSEERKIDGLEPDVKAAAEATAAEEARRLAEWSSIWLDYTGTLNSVRRTIRYHDRREFYFARVHRLATGLSALLGTIGVGAVVKTCETAAMIATGLVTLVSTTSLVWGASDMARKHMDLKRKFIELEAKMTEEGPSTAEKNAAWQAARLRIEADEPPVMRNLDRLCHNELVAALGYGTPRRIGPWQRWTAHLLAGRDYDAKEIATRQIEGPKPAT